MFQSRLCPMVLLLMIGGCAAPMGTIHSDTPPPAAVTGFDRTYRGTIRNTGAADAALDLHLPVPLYDETAYYEVVKNKWIGLGDYATDQPGR
jgi:hypothetical protein